VFRVGTEKDNPIAKDGPRSMGYHGKSHRLRLEVSTTGIDEALQGVSTDPFPTSGYSTTTGLRIPPVLSLTSTPATQPRYLFCLASLTFQDGIRLLGLRQGLTIGVDGNENVTSPPEYPIEAWVTTPTFKFVDGNVSWHCVVERQPQRTQAMPGTNAQSWAYLQSDSPAMLYNTFTNSNVTTTGAPILYIKGLTAYTPPDISYLWEPVAGLGNIHDLRFPWDSSGAWRSFGKHGIEIEGGGRLSLYASVLQTNPNTRGTPEADVGASDAFAAPEECFIGSFTSVGDEVTKGVNYWRIMGALLVEKLVGA
jgi:hypothetical protein